MLVSSFRPHSVYQPPSDLDGLHHSFQEHSNLHQLHSGQTSIVWPLTLSRNHILFASCGLFLSLKWRDHLSFHVYPLPKKGLLRKFSLSISFLTVGNVYFLLHKLYLDVNLMLVLPDLLVESLHFKCQKTYIFDKSDLISNKVTLITLFKRKESDRIKHWFTFIFNLMMGRKGGKTALSSICFIMLQTNCTPRFSSLKFSWYIYNFKTIQL